jgi:polysaccharide biosynthesis transport protein
MTMNQATTRPREATAQGGSAPGARAWLSQRDPMDGVRRAIAAVRRRKWLFGLVFLAVLAVVLLFGFTRTKLYTATASMLVNERQLNVAEHGKDVLPDVSTAENAADTEVEILRSTAVAQGTVKALNLTENPAFAKGLAKLQGVDKETAATAILVKNLKIDRPGQSNVVTIAYTSPDPALSKAVADQVGHQYLNVKEQSRRSAVDQVDRGMGDELDKLRSQLEQADAAVAAYKGAHNLFDTGPTAAAAGGAAPPSSSYTQQELSTYKQQQAQAKAALADAQARLAVARRQAQGGNAGAAAPVLQSALVQQLRTQRSQLAATYADMQSRYQPDHPDLVRTKEQLDAIDKAIAAETSRQMSGLAASARVASAQLAQADATVAQTTGTLEADNKASVQLAELQRKADGLRETYQTLLTRRNSISSQALVADEDARIFAPAVLPLNPSSPNKPLILLIGLALAGIVAAATVWIVEAFDRKLISSADIEKQLGLPHIANVPEIASIASAEDRTIAPVDFAVERSASIYAESLRQIRLQLLRSGRSGPVTVGLTSARPDEGKTTLAASLARVSAMAGSRTLLIDADVRRPMVARAFGITPKVGLVDVLRGKASIESALLRDEASGAYVLPSTTGSASSQDLFDPARFQGLLAQLGDRFDLIIFDSAPALAVADARLLLRQVDEVLMVVRWNHTPRQLANAALKRMRALDIEPVGVVTTRVDMQAVARFGHDDIDADYGSYGAYYA